MPLTDDQWRDFLIELKKKKCCLLLGPEINCLRQPGGTPVSVEGAFSDFVGKRLIQEKIAFDPTIDSFYYRANKFIQGKYPTKPYLFADEIEKFRNEELTNPPPYFKMLAKLPFHSIVTMQPDNFIADTLAASGYEMIADYYDFSDPTVKKIELSDEMQLVYNIFGSYNLPKSVAVTEKDQLVQVKSIVACVPGIPVQVTNRFKDETKSFLFLGFDFNDWHFRLVLDALQIPKPNLAYYPIYSNGYQVALMTQEFYSEKFGIEFVSPDTDVFLAQLTSRYERKYGKLDRQLTCVLDYHDDNLIQFTTLVNQLRQNGISQRMTFLYKYPGQDRAELDSQAATADVYIPLMSSSFIGDQACVDRTKAAIGQANTSLIVVITGYTSYETAFPGIKQKRLMALPRDERALSSCQGDELAKTCYELAKTINCIIR